MQDDERCFQLQIRKRFVAIPKCGALFGPSGINMFLCQHTLHIIQVQICAISRMQFKRIHFFVRDEESM